MQNKQKITCPENTTPAFKSAWVKGFLAAKAGKLKTANPYDFFDSSRGGPTFARAFHRFWNRGYEEYARRGEQRR